MIYNQSKPAFAISLDDNVLGFNTLEEAEAMLLKIFPESVFNKELMTDSNLYREAVAPVFVKGELVAILTGVNL